MAKRFVSNLIFLISLPIVLIINFNCSDPVNIVENKSDYLQSIIPLKVGYRWTYEGFVWADQIMKSYLFDKTIIGYLDTLGSRYYLVEESLHDSVKSSYKYYERIDPNSYSTYSIGVNMEPILDRVILRSPIKIGNMWHWDKLFSYEIDSTFIYGTILNSDTLIHIEQRKYEHSISIYLCNLGLKQKLIIAPKIGIISESETGDFGLTVYGRSLISTNF
ncbi:MAG: hypothetical protein HY964_09705 [Ignavibacteriales bacterium]|nr:hypothetical protein [Ignavibacteriales bacterium]